MNRINALCRNYLWSGTSEYKKAPNINWKTICLPKSEGGLGIRDAKVWNRVLLGKYIWWLARKKDHYLWVKWVNHVYLKGREWTDYTAPSDSSWSWRKITSIMQHFKQAYVGPKWLNADVDYTVIAGYDWLREKQNQVDWRHLFWNNLNIPKTSFIFWEYMHLRLPTRYILAKFMTVADQSCPICQNHMESNLHLMNECEYIKVCQAKLQQHLHISVGMQGLIQWFSSGRRVTKLQRRYVGACYVALVYWTWRIRNEARMENYVRRPDGVIKDILADIKSRLMKMNITAFTPKDRTWVQYL